MPGVLVSVTEVLHTQDPALCQCCAARGAATLQREATTGGLMGDITVVHPQLLSYC